ncbi:MAG TPA: HEAT repeat domain-containing protein [Planctomycetota bacterium]|nr:HEAT repeat domain-containing protein [Planctomycetota bacterium]
MLTTMIRRCLMVLTLLACTAVAQAYLVGPAVSLEKMTEQSDTIFKGTAISTQPAKDDWFTPYENQGFIVCETQFTVVSVIKGNPPAGKLLFRHYDEEPNSRGREFQPQYYRFAPGKTYVVFAAKADTPGVFRQLWKSHTIKADLGAVRCADSKPVAAKTVTDALWAELTAMLANANADDVTYAIRQLDEMSGGGLGWAPVSGGLSDFDRTDVLAAVRSLMGNRDPKIAQAAIAVVGSHNPYMTDERALHWLATVSSVDVPGIGKMDPKMTNPGGDLYWKDLVAIADGKADDDTRSMAVLALGLVREPALQKPIERWLADRAAAVRASAALLLADFPGPETRTRLTALAGDPEPRVRVCVARAIGFSQQAQLAGVLAKLITDADRTVREAAAMSLLSFSPKNDAIAEIFRANLANEEFQPLFLNALARENPAPYLDNLATAVERKTEPKNFWGGQIPPFAAWEILFKYLQAQPADAIRSGKLDRYLDAIEKVGNYGSSQPRDIYAFYLQRGMTERARKFREAAKKAVKYDLDYYFKQVDENPSLYKRE